VKGRNAVWHAVRALNLVPGQVVLLPSYHCGSELDAILKAGCKVAFYQVDRNCRIDMEHLRATIDAQTRALFVIHYFGFPEPRIAELRELCDAHKLFLIEDCAHALYSPVAAAGDLAVFSLWKNLPIPHGGAVRINNRALKLEDARLAPPVDDWLDVLRRLMAGTMLTKLTDSLRERGLDPLRPLANWMNRRTIRTRPVAQLADPHLTFDPATRDWSMSALSKFILEHADHDRVAQTRRANYRALLDDLGELALFSELPDAVCPLGFPVVVGDAPGLHEFLKTRHIQSDRFWNETHGAFPADHFPDAMYLKSHVILLPIHQDIDRAGVAFIARAVREWT
jgi:dTDP-4-amino-4,6-dideoxygalactose transaminase